MTTKQTGGNEPPRAPQSEIEIISFDVHKHDQKPVYGTGQTKAELRQLPPGRIGSLKPEHIRVMRPQQLQALTVAQIRALDPKHVAALSERQFNALGVDQLNALLPKQLKVLTKDQIHTLGGAQLFRQNKGPQPWVGKLPPNLQMEVRKRLSYLTVMKYTAMTPPRPRPHSLWCVSEDATNCASYTSWPALTDRSFTARHLGPWSKTRTASLPHDTPYVSNTKYGEITGLFERKTMKKSRSSLLFMYFAQWLTDSFLRTDPHDRRKNTSNHQIDMCQIYGLKESTTRLLRELKGGRLKSHKTKDGDEYPPLLFDDKGNVKVEFKDLPYVKDGRYKGFLSKFADPYERKASYFATGLERGNSTFGYTALSTLFLREHNRLCRGLEAHNKKRGVSWDDERLFQTVRLIVIALELKIMIEEYVNHIAHKDPRKRVLVFDNSYAERQPWYRTNWIAIEFDLLYRWHSLVPNKLTVAGKALQPPEFLVNNKPLLQHGVRGILHDASQQATGKIGLFNTPKFLLAAEYEAIKMSRDYNLQPYVEYCKRFGKAPPESFADITSNTTMQKELERKYRTVDNVEFLVGIYAEDPESERLFGDLMIRMVAYDAFTHALTNPLLSENIFTPAVLTDYGLKEIARTSSLNDLLKRNDDKKPPAETAGVPISMDIP